MNGQGTGDFASIMEKANEMSHGAISHPFGGTAAGITRGGRGQAAPVRQTSHVFYLPKQIAEYDEICNRGWAGEIEIRLEERTFTKEGEVAVFIVYFERHAALPRPNEVHADGDAEPEEKPQKLP